MDVLITGASGFLGGALVRRFESAGKRVAALARSKAGISYPLASGTEVVEADLAEGVLTGLPKVEAIIHTAATSPWPAVNTRDVIRDNVVGTLALVDFARRNGVRTFLFCSSMSAFGTIEETVVTERTPVRDPDAYGMTKLLGETMLCECGDELASVSFRLPAVLGPGAHRNWLAVALDQIRKQQTVEIFNADSEFNNAVHVDDLGEFCLSLLGRPLHGHDSIVLGATGCSSPRDVAETMMSALGTEVPVVEKKSPKASFTIDCTKAVESYGYRPMHIKTMIKCFALN